MDTWDRMRVARTTRISTTGATALGCEWPSVDIGDVTHRGEAWNPDHSNQTPAFSAIRPVNLERGARSATP